MLLMEKPAKAARLCGLTRLTDTLHGRWIREMVFGQGDMTLLAHRGSYKTTCLSFAMAVMLVVYPRKNLLFLRKTDSDVLEVLRQVKLLLATDAMQELIASMILDSSPPEAPSYNGLIFSPTFVEMTK